MSLIIMKILNISMYICLKYFLSKGIFFIFIISLFAPLYCATEVDTIYDKLNTPLDVEVATYSDSHLVSFYGYNIGKPQFKGYLIFQAATSDESRSLYRIADAAVKLNIESYPSLVNQDVNLMIQVKVGGNATTETLHAGGILISGYYLTIRAYPDYPANQGDNTDFTKGVAVSLPSNTVLIP